MNDPHRHDHSPKRPREERRQWHIDKSLNVGYLLTSITIVSAMLYSWHMSDVRIALLEQTIETIQADRRANREMQTRRDDRQDSDYAASVAEIKGDVREISDKIDRLIMDKTR